MERGLKKVKMAGGPGFEPGLTESESVVLPLNDPPNQLSNDQLSVINYQLSMISYQLSLISFAWLPVGTSNSKGSHGQTRGYFNQIKKYKQVFCQNF